MKTLMEIRANFRVDFCDLCKHLLEQSGYKVRKRKKDKKTKQLLAEPVEPEYFVIQYFNVEHRFVVPKPRTVVKHAGFAYPQSVEEGLRAFLEKVEAGGELMRHASTKITRADYADALLNDWRIHHFHLGTKLGKEGFVNRSDDVLFATVTSDRFYCIAVLPHEADGGAPSWAKQLLVRTVHENWPELLEQGRLPGVFAASPQASDQDLFELREAGVLVPIQMPDGTVYAGIGGGYATSRDSTRAVRRAAAYLRAVSEEEKWLRENIDEVAAWAAKQGKTLPDRLHFKLAMDETNFLAVEHSVQLNVRLALRP
jgi:hypothetical protein